ncbi:uncharacterized protein LOC121993646 [Zingiber officinale]|uniref:uncharacterized protein LOC121993646 n=2 Tax=Zingiber officinale TaxID=94328 RepID=UPI001C4B8A1E|nr:uncharacterized protein LOC121993646 [Zingiber officinale]
MAQRGAHALLLLALCALLYQSAGASSDAWDITEAEERELERQLKTLNKPYVKSFKDEYGITFDCVDFYKQPAFDHPLLKNLSLEFKPTSTRDGMDKKPSSSETLKSPKRCPEGTVLIRRIKREDLIRAKRYTQQVQAIRPQDTNTDEHSAGVRFTSGGGPMYYGAEASLDVFQLKGLLNNQASASQIILTKGEKGPRNSLNAVHVGYHVDFTVEGDNLTHFFTYWTSNGYLGTGCYNMLCSGFLQASRELAPGQVYTGNSLTLKIYKDRLGNWNLDRDSERIGFWPKAIFSNMGDASMVEMGGNVRSPMGLASPAMGSGKAVKAVMRDINMVDGQGNLYRADSSKLKLINDLGPPYYIANYDSFNLYYGGPGGWKKA